MRSSLTFTVSGVLKLASAVALMLILMLVAGLERFRRFTIFVQALSYEETLTTTLDGVVVKAGFCLPARRSGIYSRPRWAIAFLLLPWGKADRFARSSWPAGRNDAHLAAEFDPVTVAGSTIALRNLPDETRRKMREGDTIIVHKQGDVIPEVGGPL